jgi:hypothetical protein
MTRVEQIELVAKSAAEVKVRVHYEDWNSTYEVLFKHVGTDTWHEHTLSADPRQPVTVHEFFAPLLAHIRMTKP